MNRLKKAVPFIALAVVAVVIPVLATTFSSSTATAAPTATSDVNLDLVILVNRMELTKDQMQALHDILVDLVSQRTALQTALEEKKQAFEAEMLAFGGTSEELDARLAAYRTEIQALVESSRDAHTAAFEKLGALLTYKQGMLLEQVLPRLDGSLAGDLRGAAGILGMAQGARLQRMMQGAPQTAGQSGSEQAAPAGMTSGIGQAPWAAQNAPEGQAQLGQASGEGQAGAPNGQGLAVRFLRGQVASRMGRQQAGSPRGDGLDLLEQLIRVLELKLGQA
jgi:hypothetical protein